MSFLTGAKTGAEQSPWSAVLNEVNASYERRRKEDATRDAEERQLKQIFAKLAVENKNAVDLQNLKGEQDIEKEYVKGEIEGSLRPLQATPMGAVGQAMQPPPQAAMSMATGGFGDVKGEAIPEQKMASGVAQQAGLAPRTVKSPGGKEYEQVDRNNEIPEGMEIAGYDQKGRPMIRKISTAEKKFTAEQEENKKVQSAKSKMVLDSAQDTLDTIAEVEKGIDNFGTFGNVWSIPGTPRKTWQANIDKLLSGKILDTIKSMKDASKTGATGFGALNLEELKVLQNASTALKKDLPKADAQKYLNVMKSSVQKILSNEGQQNGFDPSGLSDDELRAIANGQ